MCLECYLVRRVVPHLPTIETTELRRVVKSRSDIPSFDARASPFISSDGYKSPDDII